MIPAKLGVSEDAVRSFCQKWNVVELDVFGSSLRSDFGPDSDVDLLLVYAKDAHPTLFDEGAMQEELEILFGRQVQFMTKRAVERSCNPIRRKAILERAKPVYAEST